MNYLLAGDSYEISSLLLVLNYKTVTKIEKLLCAMFFCSALKINFEPKWNQKNCPAEHRYMVITLQTLQDPDKVVSASL